MTRSSPEPGAALIAVLAGGSGGRLGGGKPGAAMGGRPLISYPLATARAALESLGLPAEPLVVAKPGTALPSLDGRVLREPDEPTHPLCGIVAALREGGGRPVVALACDMPFVSSELLAWLATLDAPLAVPRAGGRLHPLLARYEPSLLPVLEDALRVSAPLQRTVAALGPREIPPAELARFGDPERLLTNVNTAEELEAAERLLGAWG